MRKTSQDGGDSTSITSGIENEVKKASTGLAKIKRSSIKKKVQSFSHESDDGVGEPLLQKEKEKSEYPSAKYLLSKNKTDSANEKMNDTDMLLPDKERSTFTSFSNITDTSMNGTKDLCKPFVSGVSHNHMNSNIFSGPDAIKSHIIVPKTQVLVEIDGNKPGTYNSSPLIFTTAKIHTDGKSMQMEPVQVTPVPILSTIEGNVIKTSSISECERKEESSNKTSNNISSGDFTKPGPLKTLSSNTDAVLDVSKTKVEEIKNQPFTTKTSIGNIIIDSNVIDSSLKINDTKTPTNIIVKDLNPVKTFKSITAAEKIPQVINKSHETSKSQYSAENTTVTQELDVNKNFQTDPGPSKIKGPATESTAAKEIIQKPITNTIVPKEVKKMTPLPDKLETSSSTTLKEAAATLVTKTNQPTLPGNSKTSVSSPVTVTTCNKPETFKATSAFNSATTSSVNICSITTTAPKVTNSILPIKKVTKQSDQRTPVTAVTSAIPTTTINQPVIPAVSTVGKQISSNNKPTPTGVTSITQSLSAKGKNTATKTSLSTTSLPGSQTSRSQVSTISATTIPKNVLPSTFKPVVTTAYGSSATVNSNVKAQSSIAKNVATTTGKSLVSSSKPIFTTSSTTTTNVSGKSCTAITTNNQINAEPLINKPISTTASSKPSKENHFVNTPVTTTPAAKHVSSNVSSTPPSTNMMPTSGTSSKLSRTTDISKTESKAINSTVAPIMKQTEGLKTTPVTSCSQTVIPSPKTVKTLDRSTNVTKSDTSAGPAKVQKDNAVKSSSSQKKDDSNHKSSSASRPATTPSQVSMAPLVNKPNDLQNKEHKKEKLK